jgi:lipoprotein NlpD
MRTITPMTRARALNWMGLVLAAAMLAGCAAPRRSPAPVEDRGTARPAMVAPAGETARVLPGAENAGKAGYFTVRPGDTLIRRRGRTGATSPAGTTSTTRT